MHAAINSLSWIAMLGGWIGLWVTPRHRAGWLIGATCAGLWLAYDLALSLYAASIAAAVAMILSAANYYRTPRNVSPS